MSNSSRYIAKLADRDVIRALESVASKFNEHDVVITFQDQLGGLTDELLNQYRKQASYFLSGASLRIANVHWNWARLRVEHNDPNSPKYDKLTFSYNPQLGQPDRSLIISVQGVLDAALSRPLVNAGGKVEDLPAYASHSEILHAMESAAAQVLTEATSHRQDLERAYLQKEDALIARVDELRQREIARIEEERVRVDKELEERKTSLDEKSHSLDELQKKLDDRNNTHVRRNIRESLLELTKERLANFTVSSETRLQYYAVHAVALLGLTFLAGGAFWYGANIATAEQSAMFSPNAVVLAIKSALLAAAAVGLGSWYLGWLNRWLQRIADAEFKLQQFRLDIERASWLAETVLEWKATSPDPFPDLLASRLSAGLFHSQVSNSDDPKAPATHLAEALFGVASSAKLKLGNQELNLDRRAIKELQEEK